MSFLRPPAVFLLLVALLSAIAVLTPAAAQQPRPTIPEDVLERIYVACLDAHPEELLAKMYPGEAPEPAKIAATVVDTGKGYYFPALLEDNVAALEAYVDPGHRFLDLGSGDGRVVFLAHALGADATGIEYEPELVEISLAARDALGDLIEPEQVRFIEGDFFEHPWSGYDVVFYFDLGSFEDQRLRKKIAAELDPGARLLVYHESTMPFSGLVREGTIGDVSIYRQPGRTLPPAALTVGSLALAAVGIGLAAFFVGRRRREET